MRCVRQTLGRGVTVAAMRRFLLSLLLCLGLSLPAWAGLLTAGMCCPSQSGVVQPGADSPSHGDSLSDCCNDLATYLQTGQACKTGTAGSAPLLAGPQGAAPAVLVTALRAPPPTPLSSPLSAEPEGIWRPPL